MGLYLAVPLGLLALLIAASGVAAVARGWVAPMHRGLVRRVRLYGWGQLLFGLGLCSQAVLQSVDDAPGIWLWEGDAAAGMVIAGLCVVGLSQRRARGVRQDTTAL
ncbi:hypothetical protein [Streptomyces sp. NPDC059215]|uniref:hypothetical protein n=1 Tax=Streptomyces sp. NPDC059215 TaxID=3346772 RepID=UPI0036B1A73E